MKTEIYQKLLRLLQQALWSIPFKEEITPKEAGRLIALAEKQAISGLISKRPNLGTSEIWWK